MIINDDIHHINGGNLRVTTRFFHVKPTFHVEFPGEFRHRQHFVRGDEGDGLQQKGHRQRGTRPRRPKSQTCGPCFAEMRMVNGEWWEW